MKQSMCAHRPRRRRRARRLLSLVLTAAMLAGLAAASPASAIVTTIADHGYGVTPVGGVNPTSITGAYEPLGTLNAPGAHGARGFDEPPNGGGPLIDYGGPVMQSNTTHVIYWDPNGEFGATTKGVINRFFTDVAHDSGDATNVFGVDAQYGATYNSSYAGEVTDGDAYPTTGNCSVPSGADPGPPYTSCLYDAQLRTELSAFVKAEHLPTGPRQLYFLLLPHKVVTCFAEGECSNNVYCAYHSYINPGESGEIIYAVIPFSLLDSNDAKGCQWDGNSQIQTPNGDTAGTNATTRYADVALKYASHEFSESITDPLVGYETAWMDARGLEVGDKCNAWTSGSETGADPHAFLPTLGGSASAGTLYDQSINSDHYYLQSEWDNATSACLMRPALAASFGANPRTAAVGTVVKFEAKTSDPYGEIQLAWKFGDGGTGSGADPNHSYTTPGEYTVTLTASDSRTGTMQPVTETVIVNAVPTASLSISPSPAEVGTSVSFSGASSSDPGGSIVGYQWEFGDGSSGAGPTASHTYSAPGNYTVRLTVRDADGETNSASKQLTVTGAEGQSGSGSGDGTTAGLESTALNDSGPRTGGGVRGTLMLIGPARVNTRTGAVTFRLQVSDDGTLAWDLTFSDAAIGSRSLAARGCKSARRSKARRRCSAAAAVFASDAELVPGGTAISVTVVPSSSALRALRAALREAKGLPVTGNLSFEPAGSDQETSRTVAVTVQLSRTRAKARRR